MAGEIGHGPSRSPFKPASVLCNPVKEECDPVSASTWASKHLTLQVIRTLYEHELFIVLKVACSIAPVRL